MEWKKNEAGFTLISALVRLLIVTLTLPLLVMLLAKFSVKTIEEPLSIQQFFFLLQMESNLAENVNISNPDRLNLYIKGDVISIEQYGNLIRRRVNAQGHEIYQRDIKDFKLTPLTYGVLVRITSLSGEQYERVLVTKK